MASSLGQCDYFAKLLIVGDMQVGKTALLKRFADDEFAPTYISTIGVDCKFKVISVGKRTAKVTVVTATQWDTCGQERFRTITRTYYKDAQGVVLCFDFSNERSFANLRNWMQEIRINAPQGITVVLAGTKCDLADKAVSVAEAKSLAAELGVHFFETSSKHGTNVESLFLHLTTEIITSAPHSTPHPSTIRLNHRQKKRKLCC